MIVDPVTGFLEPGSHYSRVGFKAQDKVRFLELYKELGNMSACAKAVGVARQTITEHFEIDAKFKQAFDATVLAIKDEIEGVMVANAKRPQGFMDRMAWLRARFTEYNPKTVISHETSKDAMQGLLARMKDAGALIEIQPANQT